MAGSKRGFAAMDANKQREIASKGGKASGASRSARRGNQNTS
jgi:general stress protein YciG